MRVFCFLFVIPISVTHSYQILMKLSLHFSYCLLFLVYIYIYILLYHGKEKMHSEIKLIIYSLSWYSPTSIIILALLVLYPKLVLLLTACLSASAVQCLRDKASFIFPQYQKSRGTRHYTTHTHIYMCVYVCVYDLGSYVKETLSHLVLLASRLCCPKFLIYIYICHRY